MTASVVFDAQDNVGESLVYDTRRDALVWVDIGGKRIHRLYLSNKLPNSLANSRSADINQTAQ